MSLIVVLSRGIGIEVGEVVVVGLGCWKVFLGGLMFSDRGVRGRLPTQRP